MQVSETDVQQVRYSSVCEHRIFSAVLVADLEVGRFLISAVHLSARNWDVQKVKPIISAMKSQKWVS
jgi:hypothetical protein